MSNAPVVTYLDPILGSVTVSTMDALLAVAASEATLRVINTTTAAIITALGSPAQNGTGYAPSGLSPVTGSFTGTGQSASFIPLAGPRMFNVTTRGTFVASFQLERSFDMGSNWHPITATSIQLYAWTAPESEQAQEDQFGILYRLNCTAYTSGTVYYRISQ